MLRFRFAAVWMQRGKYRRRSHISVLLSLSSSAKAQWPVKGVITDERRSSSAGRGFFFVSSMQDRHCKCPCQLYWAQYLYRVRVCLQRHGVGSRVARKRGTASSNWSAQSQQIRDSSIPRIKALISTCATIDPSSLLVACGSCVGIDMYTRRWHGC